MSRKSAGQFKQSRLSGLVAAIWHAMSTTGNGYKRHSLRHTGIDDDRRNDKLREITEYDEDGKPVTKHIPFLWGESKLQRSARLCQIGVRH